MVGTCPRPPRGLLAPTLGRFPLPELLSPGWAPLPRLSTGDGGLDLLFQTKENDELTRICDDLISKMEKI